MRLQKLKADSKFEIEIVDTANAFALRSWQKMGSPEPPTRQQTKDLKIKALDTKKLFITANKKGELNWKYALEPWAIVLIRQLNRADY